MCGLIGYIGSDAATKILHGLMFLQHRGQDATGVATVANSRVFIEKGFGLVADVFDDPNKIKNLQGDCGIGHVRYTTSGDPQVLSAVQPFYVNQPYGMTLAHNGNLTNAHALRTSLTTVARRHISSHSDSELLLNMFAHLLDECTRNGEPLTPAVLFGAVSQLHSKCEGAYSVLISLAGIGLLAFRDPHGVRPLVFGSHTDDASGRANWLFASENVPFRSLGFSNWQGIPPGAAVFIDQHGICHQQQCAAAAPPPRPCIFEYIYLARPDSTLNNASVYEVRTRLGAKLAQTIQQHYANLQIDCVVPVPDSGRVTAMELAHVLGIPYREGLVKNRYIGRTFIEAGASKRVQSVRQKLNVIESEFAGKSVLLVDDSIVRGTTSKELVQLARQAGARRVYFASAAPPVRFPNVYGIDIPTRGELVAGRRSVQEVANFLEVDCLIYQQLDDMVAAISEVCADLQHFETSCFDGNYLIGNVSEDYLEALEAARSGDADPTTQPELLLNP